MGKNLFVVCLDEFNHDILRRVENYDELNVHPLYSFEEVVEADSFSFNALFEGAKRQLNTFNGQVDAIIGWWDFPTSCLVPALCDAYGLPAQPLESVVKCEHKYWSRVVQSEVAPESVIERMMGVSERVIRRLSYDNATFNIEFFWDESSDDLRLLELNPRLSQSHADLFAMVHGVSHFQIMVDLALGREPHWLSRKGSARYAAKFFVTRHEDALVSRVPDEETIRALESEFPGTDINITVREGTVLAEQPLQEAYGHELADVFVGGNDPQELLETFRAVRERLPFRFDTSQHEDQGGSARV